MIVLAAGAEGGKAGPFGLLVLLLLVVACYLLFKSMSRHLRKVRDDWPGEQPRSSPRPESPPEQPVRPGPVRTELRRSRAATRGW